jgi:hypothetical protein
LPAGGGEVIALAIALGVVGLAAVLAAWSLGARWLAVTAAKVRGEDVSNIATGLELVDANARTRMAEAVARLDALEEKAADLEEQLRKARVANIGGRRS